MMMMGTARGPLAGVVAAVVGTTANTSCGVWPNDLGEQRIRRQDEPSTTNMHGDPKVVALLTHELQPEILGHESFLVLIFISLPW